MNWSWKRLPTNDRKDAALLCLPPFMTRAAKRPLMKAMLTGMALRLLKMNESKMKMS